MSGDLRVTSTVRVERVPALWGGDRGEDAYETCVSVLFTLSAHVFRTATGGRRVTLSPTEMAAALADPQCHERPVLGSPAARSVGQGSVVSNRIRGYRGTASAEGPSFEGTCLPRSGLTVQMRPTITVCDGYAESRSGSTCSKSGSAAPRNNGSEVSSMTAGSFSEASSGRNG